MKGTNIQVNGNVYGGIHVYNGRGASALPCDVAPRSHDGSSWALTLGKWLAIAVIATVALCGALVALALMFSMACSLCLAFVAFYVLCRTGTVLHKIERALGGSPTRLVGATLVQRALTPGHKVRELDALARETDYVDSN